MKMWLQNKPFWTISSSHGRGGGAGLQLPPPSPWIHPWDALGTGNCMKRWCSPVSVFLQHWEVKHISKWSQAIQLIKNNHSWSALLGTEKNTKTVSKVPDIVHNCNFRVHCWDRWEVSFHSFGGLEDWIPVIQRLTVRGEKGVAMPQWLTHLIVPHCPK